MKELIIKKTENGLVADSRDVAKLMGVRHYNLLRDIRKYITVLSQPSILSDGAITGIEGFFIEKWTTPSTGNKSTRYYELTRKGCDMVANKMTGEKGILFTAAYIERFYAMEEEIRNLRIKQLENRLERYETSSSMPYKYVLMDVKNFLKLRVCESSENTSCTELYDEYAKWRKYQEVTPIIIFEQAVYDHGNRKHWDDDSLWFGISIK